MKRVAQKPVEVDGDKLVISVDDPEKENPDIVNAVDSAGGRILMVSVVSSSLEDVYLKLVRS